MTLRPSSRYQQAVMPRLLAVALVTSQLAFLVSCATVTVVLQNGRSVQNLATGVSEAYASNLDRTINTQYAAGYNHFNGVNYGPGSMSTSAITDSYNGDGTSFRWLTRFDLTAYVPAGATIMSAELVLGFVNWLKVVDVEACHMASLWQPYAANPGNWNYTGWAYAYVDTTTGQPVAWPGGAGGWGDCNTAVTYTTAAISNNGGIRRALQLDPRMVQAWLDSPATNYGLLFRSTVGNGTASVVTSLATSQTAQRLLLTLTYSTDPAATAQQAQPQWCYPAARTYTASARLLWVDAAAGSDTTGNGMGYAPFRTVSKAQTVATSSDKILVREGSYVAPVTFKTGVVEAAPGASVTVTASRRR